MIFFYLISLLRGKKGAASSGYFRTVQCFHPGKTGAHTSALIYSPLALMGKILAPTTDTRELLYMGNNNNLCKIII